MSLFRVPSCECCRSMVAGGGIDAAGPAIAPTAPFDWVRLPSTASHLCALTGRRRGGCCRPDARCFVGASCSPADVVLHHAINRWRRADHRVKDRTGLRQGIEMILQFLGSHLRVVLAHEAEDVFERHEAFGDDHAVFISKIRRCPGITGSMIAAAQGCAQSRRMLHLFRHTPCANSEQGGFSLGRGDSEPPDP
jgi:hypothetical protein